MDPSPPTIIPPPIFAAPPTDPLPPPLLAQPEPRSSILVAIIQVGIVMLVGVLPDFLSSAASLFVDYSERKPHPLWFGATYIIIRSVIVSGVTLGMICWAREPWAVFGFRPPRWRDLAWVIVGTLGSWILYYLLAILAWMGVAALTIMIGTEIPLESSYRFPMVHGDWDLVWLLAMSLFNGFAEEIVMRAFLLPRFEHLLGGGRTGALLALFTTSAIFASYHAYQGVYGVVGAFAAGITLGLIFLKTRSIWPVFLAHALMDALALLMMGGSR